MVMSLFMQREQVGVSGEQLAEALGLEGGICRSIGLEVAEPKIDLLLKLIQLGLTRGWVVCALGGVARSQDTALEIEGGGFETIESDALRSGGVRTFQVLSQRFRGLSDRVPGLAGFGQPLPEFRFGIGRHFGTHPMVSGVASGYR
jgi:hypothetical protein